MIYSLYVDVGQVFETTKDGMLIYYINPYSTKVTKQKDRDEK